MSKSAINSITNVEHCIFNDLIDDLMTAEIRSIVRQMKLGATDVLLRRIQSLNFKPCKPWHSVKRKQPVPF